VSFAALLYPIGGIFPLRASDAAQAPPGSAASRDQPCVFKYFRMLGDGGSFPGHQVGKNGPPRRVSKGCKGAREPIGRHLY
jgi:hypothetical protein